MQEKKNELTLEETVEITKNTVSSISQELRVDARSGCYQREYMLDVIDSIIESSKKAKFMYAFTVRYTEDLKREIGNEQSKLLTKDIFNVVQTHLSSVNTAECGVYDEHTMLIASDDDISLIIKDLITKQLLDDYEGLSGIFYNVGGTNTVKHDSLVAVLARLEFATKKTDSRKNEVYILTAK